MKLPELTLGVSSASYRIAPADEAGPLRYVIDRFIPWLTPRVFSIRYKSFTLYVGVTNDLTRRLWEHKNKLLEGFTKKYNIDKLIYYEEYSDIKEALNREKQIKSWSRVKKINLIKTLNSDFTELVI